MTFFVSFQRADIAMADLTINYQREMVVDFTMPFLDLGKIGVVPQKMVYSMCMINEGADLSKTVNIARYHPLRNIKYRRLHI